MSFVIDVGNQTHHYQIFDKYGMCVRTGCVMSVAEGSDFCRGHLKELRNEV